MLSIAMHAANTTHWVIPKRRFWQVWPYTTLVL